MEVDFTIELGREDPVLDFPWTDPDGRLTYLDLKRQPEALALVSEAQEFSELGHLLRNLNSTSSLLESAKCDAWSTRALTAEEQIFGATIKFASYVDLIFTTAEHRVSFALHEYFAKQLTALLHRAPEIPSSVEVCVRRCYFHSAVDPTEGFYFTVYVNGFGDDEARARQNWGIALRLAGNAMLQLSAAGLT